MDRKSTDRKSTDRENADMENADMENADRANTDRERMHEKRMHEKRMISFVIAFCLLISLISPAATSYGQEVRELTTKAALSETNCVTDVDQYQTPELIVVYEEGNEIDQVLPEGVVEEKLTDNCSYVTVKKEADLEKTIEALAENDQVVCVEPNYPIKMFYTNDEYSDRQWAYYDPGVSIGLEEAWTYGTGANSEVVVAVLDTGIDYMHADLATNMWTNSSEISDNGVDDDGNGYVDDYYGWNFSSNSNAICNYEMDTKGSFVDLHGTHVAGIIGAVTNNGIGVSGVASSQNIKIMSVKVMNNVGECTVADIINGIHYAEANGAKICNLSLGLIGFDSTALYNEIKNSSMLFVCAAGNGGDATNGKGFNIDETPVYPASYDLENVISVANTNVSGQVDPSSCYGQNVDIAAPGTLIASTYVDSAHTSAGEYGFMTGTSMAAPFVTGTAAYLSSYYGGLSGAIMKEMILGGSTHPDVIGGMVADNAYLSVAGALNYDGGKLEFTTKIINVKNSNNKKFTINVDNPFNQNYTLLFEEGTMDLDYFRNGGGIPLTENSTTILTKATKTYTLYMMDSQGNETIKSEKVTVPVLKKVVLPAAKKTLKVKKTYQLKPTLTQTGVYAKLTYKSNNKAVAKVTAAGKITALKKGKATITVTATYGSVVKKATCKITVTK